MLRDIFHKITFHVKDDEGIAFITVLVVSTVLSLSAAAHFAQSSQEAGTVMTRIESTQALYAAEAAVEWAKYQLKDENEWYDWESNVDTPGVNTPIQVEFSYDEAINLGTIITTSLDAAGTPLRKIMVEVSQEVGGWDPVFLKALCACGEDRRGLHIQGSGRLTTDSYNSQNGSYYSQTPGNHGDLGSSGDIDIGVGTINGLVEADGWVDGHSGAVINGDAIVADYVRDRITVNGTLTEWHTFTEPVCDCSRDLSSAVADARDNNDNDRIPDWAWNRPNEILLTGNDVITLDSGVYYLEDLEVRGNAQIICNGEVVIYMYDDSDLELKGTSVINTDNNASNLRIYLHNETSMGRLKITGNTNLSAAIYAPNAKCEIVGNANYFGALTARDIKIRGTPDFHYDEDILTKLSDIPSESPTVNFISWRELDPLGN